MYLYNSATHKKEELKTHTPNHVEMGASRSIRIDAPLTTPGTPRSTPRP